MSSQRHHTVVVSVEHLTRHPNEVGNKPHDHRYQHVDLGETSRRYRVVQQDQAPRQGRAAKEVGGVVPALRPTEILRNPEVDMKVLCTSDSEVDLWTPRDGDVEVVG